MDNYRYRPKDKDNYIYEATWKELNELTENLKNELIFYDTDLKFLKQLIEAHYIELLVFEDADTFKDLQNNIKISLDQCNALLKCIPVFKMHFNNLIYEPNLYESSVLRSEYLLFEDDCSYHIRTVKIIRLKTLAILKTIINKETSKYFWKFN